MYANFTDPFALECMVAEPVRSYATSTIFHCFRIEQGEAKFPLHGNIKNPRLKAIRRIASAHPNEGVGCVWGEEAGEEMEVFRRAARELAVSCIVYECRAIFLNSVTSTLW